MASDQESPSYRHSATLWVGPRIAKNEAPLQDIEKNAFELISEFLDAMTSELGKEDLFGDSAKQT